MFLAPVPKRCRLECRGIHIHVNVNPTNLQQIEYGVCKEYIMILATIIFDLLRDSIHIHVHQTKAQTSKPTPTRETSVRPEVGTHTSNLKSRIVSYSLLQPYH